jgi:hypothetical protein
MLCPAGEQPYESVYAGNFIFTLGYFAGREDLKLEAHEDRNLEGDKERKLEGHCASLFNQNAADKLIGDVVCKWGGRDFIIEFKRNEEKVMTEFEKPHKEYVLQILNQQNPEAEAIRAFSRKGHFVGFGVPGGDRWSDMAFIPYLDIVDEAVQPGERILTNEFLDYMRRPDSGLTPEQFEAYTKGLVACWKRVSAAAAAGGSARAPVTISALVMNYDAASKRFRYLQVDLMKLKKLTLQMPDPDLVLKRGLENTRERDRGHGREHGRGRGNDGRGM